MIEDEAPKENEDELEDSEGDEGDEDEDSEGDEDEEDGDKDDETSELSEEDQELAEEMASGRYETSHDDDELEVLLVYGDPTRYYCTLRRPEEAPLCAAQPGIGGYTYADDGGGQDSLWLLAGAALPLKLAVAVVRAFERGEPPVLPFVPAFIYHEAGIFFSDWSGPKPLRRDNGALAVELKSAPTSDPASCGVWQALTHVTVTTPEVLAFITTHPLPNLRRLHTFFLDLTGQGAALQAALDAHPHMAALEIGTMALERLPPLSAPQLRRLIIEHVALGDEADAVEQAATALVSRWQLAEDIEIEMGGIGSLDLSDPDCDSDKPF